MDGWIGNCLGLWISKEESVHNNVDTVVPAPAPSYFHQFFCGDTKTFLRRPRHVISSSCPGSTLRSLLGQAFLKHLPTGALGRHHLAPPDVEEQSLYSLMSRLQTLSLRLNPNTLQRKLNYENKLHAEKNEIASRSHHVMIGGYYWLWIDHRLTQFVT